MFTPELAAGTKMRFHIGEFRGKVVLDFGVSVSHLEMGPHEAEQIAELLIKHAQAAKVPNLDQRVKESGL
jgi:hypothetical protein